MNDMPETKDLFDLSKSIMGEKLESVRYPWNALSKIGGWILEIGKMLSKEEYLHPCEDVWIAKSADVADTASIKGPCIVGERAEIRHCAFIRGNVVVGCGAVVGNSTEVKNSILFDEAKAPHFNYVGDSILGYKAHFGAGVITSNVKLDEKNVVIKNGNVCHPTGRKKVGAMVGDLAEIGCSTVLNPGTVIGRNSNVYPLTTVRGIVPENCIVKGGYAFEKVETDE